MIFERAANFVHKKLGLRRVVWIQKSNNFRDWPCELPASDILSVYGLSNQNWINVYVFYLIKIKTQLWARSKGLNSTAFSVLSNIFPKPSQKSKE